ncbi:MAG: hypothetical protein M1833_003825 [Piccolia ochrophora]|nr:MAG: hypothetical protein M1833_003825 [Piccolia ochrophora]
MASTLPKLPILDAISRHDPQSIAIAHHPSGRKFTYQSLLGDVAQGKARLRQTANGASVEGQRIAFLVENGYDYVVTLLSILASHAIALPLCPTFPAHELRYILNNSEATLLLSSTKFQSKALELLKDGLDRKPTIGMVEKRMGVSHDGSVVDFEGGRQEGRGGVLLPQSAITAQCQSLMKAWNYSPKDRLLHVLPLHHIHGLINALMTPLFAGSSVEFMFPFNANSVWERLGAPFLPQQDHNRQPRERVTFLTVVPTIYNRLLSTHTDLPSPLHNATKEALAPRNLRLNISGSAALPTPTKAAWTDLSGGNALLERYGMTEVGMALSCGLDFNDRVDGSVGWPLPSVEARLVDTETGQVIASGDDLDRNGREREGEIQLRGPTVFKEYWRNPKATAEEFVDAGDGKGKWFKTGDVAVRREDPGAGQSGQEWAKGPMYFIKGRKSVDIIKTGGEKVSALEIERELLSLPQIAEVAVVGLPSDAWGQKVAAVVVLDPAHAESGKGKKKWGAMDMRRALRDRLANYKIPQELKIMDDALPRNAMGKINKKSLIKEVFGDKAA